LDNLSYKTISANKANVNKQWVIVDADGQNGIKTPFEAPIKPQKKNTLTKVANAELLF
jgi:uncharacterized lipoprotein YmbA